MMGKVGDDSRGKEFSILGHGHFVSVELVAKLAWKKCSPSLYRRLN
jgi:hypothetical protein